MKPKDLLRIASLLMFLHAIGHTMGALTWKKAQTPAMQTVVDAMVNTHHNFMGHSVSLGSFFDGYGFTMIGVLLLMAILLWQLSTNPIRKFILPLSLFLLFMGICELIWFFPFAAAFSLLAGIFSLYAYFKSPLWKPSN